MNKLFATALCLGLAFSTQAPASETTPHADIAYCTEMADSRAQNTGTSATNAAINGAANVVGAIIGGHNPVPAISGAAQFGIHGIANDARNAEWRRQSMIDACLRERSQR